MKEVRLVTYNIDGLPSELDLKDLPWILRPISWVYKLFKGTTKITINDNPNRAADIVEISKYLNSLNADIITVQEDFNYHKELMSNLTDYTDSTHTGDISLDHFFSKVEWDPLPRFKADGLNLIKNNRVLIAAEDIVPWNVSNGYIGHANDKLTHKGFRYYRMYVDYRRIDLYVVHMDADFYDPVNNPDVSGDYTARREQLLQLLEYIQEKNSNNPTIILGDTNSVDKYSWDKENIDLLRVYGFIETEIDNQDVDRLFYKGDIEVVDAYYGICGLSDHRPLIVDLKIGENVKKPVQYDALEPSEEAHKEKFDNEGIKKEDRCE